MKTCYKCQRELPEEKFSRDKSTKDGLRARCRDCMSAVWKSGYAADPEKWKKRSREWNLKNPEKRKQIQHNADLQAHYGISLPEFEEMLMKQNRRCALCSDELRAERNGANMDHDHKTGKIREILCAACNVGIGCFQDCQKRLLAAVAYLQKHSS